MNAFYEYLNEMDIYFFVSLMGIAYIIILLGMTAWSFFKKDADKHPLLDCAKCGPGGSTFLVPSPNDGNKKICPDCFDEEWTKKHLQSAPSLL